jgi:hypothetical protein
MPLATTVVFLAPGEPDVMSLADGGRIFVQPEADDEEQGEMLARIQSCVSDWATVQEAAEAVGITKPTHLGSLLLLADTLAGVAAQLTLLPLADAAGRPSLALWAAQAAIACLGVHPDSMLGLSCLEPDSTAAAAWQWWVKHGAAASAAAALATPTAASSPATAVAASGAAAAAASQSDTVLAGDSTVDKVAAADRQWLLDLVAAAGSIPLAVGCALPFLQAGGSLPPSAASVMFHYRFNRDRHLLLAAVPSSKHASVQLGRDQVAGMADVVSSAGGSMCCSPLVVRERLYSRTGVLLIPVEVSPQLPLAGPVKGAWMDRLLVGLTGTGFRVLDVTQWR